MALLILWLPVCAKSSRFSQICAPPMEADNRRACVSGVARPM
jgi:hypothetical protein